MILTRRDVALYGVHLVQVKVEDRLNAQSEVLYFTEDGFKISPTIGSYGDGVRWSVGSFAQPASSTLRRVTRPFGVHHTSNLSQAAEFIRKIQRREANPSASATVKAQSPDAEAGSKSTDIQSSQGREGAYHE